MWGFVADGAGVRAPAHGQREQGGLEDVSN